MIENWTIQRRGDSFYLRNKAVNISMIGPHFAAIPRRDDQTGFSTFYPDLDTEERIAIVRELLPSIEFAPGRVDFFFITEADFAMIKLAAT